MSPETTVLGYPRIGAKRELKRCLEAYWKGKIDVQALRATAAEVRNNNYQSMLDAGIQQIPVGGLQFLRPCAGYYCHAWRHT